MSISWPAVIRKLESVAQEHQFAANARRHTEAEGGLTHKTTALVLLGLATALRDGVDFFGDRDRAFPTDEERHRADDRLMAVLRAKKEPE